MTARTADTNARSGSLPRSSAWPGERRNSGLRVPDENRERPSRHIHRPSSPCANAQSLSVLVGTIFHGSKIPVRTWLFVLHEMCASKNGVAAREVQRKYGLTAKSAWFLTRRI